MAIITIKITEQQLKNLLCQGEIVLNLSGEQSLAQPRPNHVSFFQLIRMWAEKLVQTGNLRTAETYRSALAHFSSFRDGVDLLLPDITPTLMEEYQSYLRSRQLTMNTVSFHMRILRSVYHKGIKQGLAVDCQPFRGVYTGHAPTQKRALTAEMMKQVASLEQLNAQLLFARDMFLLSFLLRGMSFVDMAYLKPTDIHDGRLFYKRHKTGQMMSIRWEQRMQDLVNLHPNPSAPYLLPIITKQNGKERNQYRHRQTRINHDLKTIAQMAGIKTKLTMYCARHSWATIARELQVPLNVISRAMGHTDEKTTEIYIRSVETEVVDQANEKIIKLL